MPAHKQSRCIFVFTGTISARFKEEGKKKRFHWFPSIVTVFFFFLHWCCTNLSPLLLTNPAVSLCASFVLTEYLRGDVLPVEQHAATDLPCLLHPNAHLKALMDVDAPHRVLKAFRLTETHFILTAATSYISCGLRECRCDEVAHKPHSLKWGQHDMLTLKRLQ